MANYSDATYTKLGKLLAKLADNPKTRPVVTRAITAVDPSYKFPEHETEDLKNYIDSRLDEKDEEQEREKLLRSLAIKRARVMKSFGDNPEEQEKNIAAVEDLMKQTGLTDYERAAKLYAAENPPPAPKPESPIGTRWEMPNVERLFNDQRGYETDLANQAISQIIANRQRVA